MPHHHGLMLILMLTQWICDCTCTNIVILNVTVHIIIPINMCFSKTIDHLDSFDIKKIQLDFEKKLWLIISLFSKMKIGHNLYLNVNLSLCFLQGFFQSIRLCEYKKLEFMIHYTGIEGQRKQH